MIEKVRIFNRFNMETFAAFNGLNFPYQDKNWALVSIYTTPEELLLTEKRIEAFKLLGMKDHISLCFWDIAPETDLNILEKYPDARFFSIQQGEAVIEFLDKVNKMDEAVLVAHCDAGVSRSGAVGEFTVEHFNLDHKEFIKENPYLHPNKFVVRTLREASGYKYESAFGEVE